MGKVEKRERRGKEKKKKEWYNKKNNVICKMDSLSRYIDTKRHKIFDDIVGNRVKILFFSLFITIIKNLYL